MQKHILMTLSIVVSAFIHTAIGEVSIRVYHADGNTPLEFADVNTPYIYQDIMVDTNLAIIVSSDAAEYWDGGFFITDTDRDYGFLSGRDFNDINLDWSGSHFEAAGDKACVYNIFDDIRSGFELYGYINAVEGDWFVIDYTATKVGKCEVGFYDYSISWLEPAFNLVFSQVPTRDYNGDTIVNFADFVVFASNWQLDNCNGPGWCMGTDLDMDGFVDVKDLLLFAKFWLNSIE